MSHSRVPHKNEPSNFFEIRCFTFFDTNLQRKYFSINYEHFSGEAFPGKISVTANKPNPTGWQNTHKQFNIFPRKRPHFSGKTSLNVETNQDSKYKRWTLNLKKKQKKPNFTKRNIFSGSSQFFYSNKQNLGKGAKLSLIQRNKQVE